MVLVLVLAAAGGGVMAARGGAGGGPASPAADEHRTVVQPRPFQSTISLVGTITPGDSVAVTAPFDGVVSQVNLDYGRAVASGQVLVVLDVAELEQHRREAEAAWLKAREADADLAAWKTGPDVTRARRAVTAAETTLAATQRKAAETRRLLDQGLVARTEYDDLARQSKSDAMALDGARDDLAATLRKGEGAARAVAALELQNARVHRDELAAQQTGATVIAPVAGVMVRPPVDKGDKDDGALHVGQHLARGQLIGSIAKADGLAVDVRLDEADANRVRDGQAARITGPGFAGLTLTGTVTRVAGQASDASPGPQQGSSFAATVRLDDLSAAQAAAIRIGMTANVAIAVYQVASALVVPPDAVRGGAAGPAVWVQDPGIGPARLQPVTIGAVAPDGVEIRTGLKRGDLVVWRDARGRAGPP